MTVNFKIPPNFKRALEWVFSTKVLFFALIWLCFLVVAGTLAQAQIGLYQAQEKYFSSFFFWLWYIPLPGAYPVMALIFLGLLGKLAFFTTWKPRFYGTIVVHVGALLLLFGGFLTAVFSSEGSMVIAEGDSTSYVRDYHKIELAITDRANPEYDQTTTFASGWLEEGQKIEHKNLPFSLEVLQYCRNCQLLRRNSDAPADYRGMARNFKLLDIPLNKDETRNMAGLVFRLNPSDSAAGPGGVYAIFENMSILQTFQIGGGDYLLEIRHVLRKLPFTIELIDFVKDEHPGTSMARSYSSEVNLIADGITQRVLISMNHPLRHGGYTFYQSSFMQGGMGETTVLAVVDNVGRLFPYISSLIMSIGLLIHLMIKMPVLFRKEKQESES